MKGTVWTPELRERSDTVVVDDGEQIVGCAVIDEGGSLVRCDQGELTALVRPPGDVVCKASGSQDVLIAAAVQP